MNITQPSLSNSLVVRFNINRLMSVLYLCNYTWCTREVPQGVRQCQQQ